MSDLYTCSGIHMTTAKKALYVDLLGICVLVTTEEALYVDLMAMLRISGCCAAVMAVRGSAVRVSDCQSSGPGFKSTCCYFEGHN